MGLHAYPKCYVLRSIDINYNWLFKPGFMHVCIVMGSQGCVLCMYESCHDVWITHNIAHIVGICMCSLISDGNFVCSDLEWWSGGLL